MASIIHSPGLMSEKTGPAHWQAMQTSPEQGAPEELRDFLSKRPEVRTLELLLPDINGILRGKRIGREAFGTLYEEGIRMCASTPLMDSRGEMAFDTGIGGGDGAPDLISRPAPNTLAPVPWLNAAPVAQVFVSLREPSGAPWFADSRQVLRRVCELLRDAGLRAVVAVEFEFYLLDAGDDAVPQPRLGRIPGTGLKQEGLQYGAMEDLWECDPLLADIQRYCEAQNVPANTALGELSPGQFEINLRHVDDAVLACDHGAMLKRIIKGATHQHGLGAAFMAKPFVGQPGSGLHVHVSLLDEHGNNVFADPATKTRPAVSTVLEHAIGGLQQTMTDAMAIFAPNANSYRRLQPNSFVPLSPNWGYNHRAVALRIPVCNHRDMRIEHRVAGADANPYLVVAAILAGIHHGITRRCKPGEMIAEKTILEDQEATLPRRWEAALERFRDSDILPGYLGEEFCRVYRLMRHSECERFHEQVSNRDYEWYLRGV